jgi:hypothetical protein
MNSDGKIGAVLAAVLVGAGASEAPRAPEPAPTVQAPRRDEPHLIEEGAPAVSSPVQSVEQAPPAAVPSNGSLMLMGVGS